jgi:hypothetical protein
MIEAPFTEDDNSILCRHSAALEAARFFLAHAEGDKRTMADTLAALRRLGWEIRRLDAAPAPTPTAPTAAATDPAAAVDATREAVRQ